MDAAVAIPQLQKQKSADSRHCCVPFCSNDGRRDKDRQLSFHQFPKDKKLRDEWIRLIRRDTGKFFKITPATPVCSAHFKPSDFKKCLSASRQSLVKGAVPTVFPFQKSPKKRKPPAKRLNLSNPQQSQEVEQGTSSRNEETTLQDEHISPAHPDHDYAVPPTCTQQQLQAAHIRIKELEDMLDKEKTSHFCLGKFAGNDAKIKKYTGFPDYKTFIGMFQVLQPTAQTMIRWNQLSRNKDVEKCRADVFHQESMQLIDQFFMLLCRIKVNFDEETLSDMFRVSQATVSRTLITWLNYLYCILGAITVWPSREAVDEKMPQIFKKSFPKTRVIIDCTELFVQIPSSKVLNSMTYSYYKGHTTYKSLVGISPDGSVVFISSLYTRHGNCQKG